MLFGVAVPLCGFVFAVGSQLSTAPGDDVSPMPYLYVGLAAFVAGLTSAVLLIRRHVINKARLRVEVADS